MYYHYHEQMEYSIISALASVSLVGLLRVLMLSECVPWGLCADDEYDTEVFAGEKKISNKDKETV